VSQAPKPRILLVDDNQSFRELVGSWLSSRSEVVVASSATDGLAALDRFTPDLIILDVMMPEISGRDMYRQLRARHGTAEVPVLFLTAYHQVLGDQDAAFFQRSRVLLKPFRLEELTEQIDQMLGARGPD
jgi:two-component system OmpR family response regulator